MRCGKLLQSLGGIVFHWRSLGHWIAMVIRVYCEKNCGGGAFKREKIHVSLNKSDCLVFPFC